MNLRKKVIEQPYLNEKANTLQSLERSVHPYFVNCANGSIIHEFNQEVDTVTLYANGNEVSHNML
jgi:hypothetical protein